MNSLGQKNLVEEIATLKTQLAEQAIELNRRNQQLEIEDALDNLRIRAGRMRSSSELGEASATLFQQLNRLGIRPLRTAVGIFDDPNQALELWVTSYTESREMTGMLYYFSYHTHPVFENIISAREQHKPYGLTILSGNAVRSYYQTMSTYLAVPRQPVYNEKEFFYSFFFTGGTINLISDHEQTEEQCGILIRFAQVFGLIYTRFLDLQTAETSIREAKIESSLERVRAKALAMQKPEELSDVIQFFRNEMGMLGEDELKTCHIYIYDEKARKSACWLPLTNPLDAESNIGSGEFEIELPLTSVGREMLQFYESPAKETSIVMTSEIRKEWIDYCDSRCAPLKVYYSEEITEGADHLYKFSDGAIGLTSVSVITQQSWDLLKRVAAVFSLTYSRFKDLTQARIDLQNLKEEKSRAENALANLQAVQKQLIQSEKMASLGELTAGIAHEIQNPLNFVNNFSDVSRELVDEMTEELENGDIKQAKQIAIDIKQNLEKINHHGRRADSIVKSMLEHSRISSGEKKETDINKLVDEYLRLSYHGMRSKDKSFNADILTKFDASIGKITVAAQDIGRVILNLVNNAFYAVYEKQQQGVANYKPVVSVTTRRNDNHIEISVADNGNGISDKIKHKIFQPFFTTKPTGQGTGLGLSLSYDIVKAHGGELKVQSTENEGSEFIIQLPVV